ncbi:unnamed protein product [Adineta steineri]|uniref:Transcription elongation factor S-II n=2 Tax=Adineta steineri TaxID=433720 RepID=A0A814NR52_9BILA|nr:unnamed protein product [Adineta steineri]CAF1339642.1 unnamed protein product [Adineta steineri]
MINKSEINESIARTLLVRLEELHVPLMVLQRTGIGKTVNELRRTITNENLATMTKNLLKNWKKLLPNSFVKDNKSTTTQSTISNSNVPWYTADNARLKSRELLVSALSINAIPEGSSDPEELCARIEDAIFKEIKDTKIQYGRRIRSRIFNLRDTKNPDLRTKVLAGIITPEQLAVMTTQEMISDTLKKECDKLKEITHRESLLGVDDGIGCDLIQCEQCKKNNCSYSELQTLSGDEPMTLFVLCRNCGHRWRG